MATGEYDVAISFLAEDQPIAQALAEQLEASTLKVFFFPHNQKELAGTNGMESMRAPFLGARVNVVLFKQPWGETPWTRVEDAAISERCFKGGWSSLMFVQLDKASKLPEWLPPMHVRFAMKDYGIDQLVGAIKLRVQEQGGTFSEESVAQRGQRLMRAAEFAEEAERFRLKGGVAAANAAVASLLDGLAQHAKELTEGSRLTFSVETDSAEHVVISPNAVLAVCWRQTYVNSLSDSELAVGFYDKFPRFYGTVHLEDARKLESAKFDFKLVGPSRPAWVSDKTEVAPDDMAKHLMMRLMHHDEMELRRKNKRTR
jgi:hypothetical protein